MTDTKEQSPEESEIENAVREPADDAPEAVGDDSGAEPTPAPSSGDATDGDEPAPSDEGSDRRIAELESEVASLKERYLRAVADLENYRRRALREKEELRTLAVANFFESLLTPLDNFRLGLDDAAKREEATGIVGGFRMVFEQISNTVTDAGIETLSPAPGDPFDPNHHDCVAHHPSGEHAEGLVTATARPGYRLRERLIRPASVVVSSGTASGGADDDPEAPAS